MFHIISVSYVNREQKKYKLFSQCVTIAYILVKSLQGLTGDPDQHCYPPPPTPPPPFHWTAIPLSSWRSRNFSKIIPNRRGSVDSHTILGFALPVPSHYASTTLPLRSCYDPTTTMKIWLRLVYADDDLAATLLRPWRWSYAFVALLYPFYTESEIPTRFYYDLGASTALLPFLLRFMSF